MKDGGWSPAPRQQADGGARERPGAWAEAFAALLLQAPAIVLTLMCALHPRSAAPSSRAWSRGVTRPNRERNHGEEPAAYR